MNRGVSRVQFLLAVATGVIVANLYYAQPLIGVISQAIGLPAEGAGLIVTLAQIGYGLGLVLLVPLADLWENRRLVVGLMLISVAALAGAAFFSNGVVFLAASFLLGMASVSAQILVPFAAHLAPEAERGRAVGNVVSGLLLGIMLARPVSALIADLWGWHAVFMISGAAIILLAVLLITALPRRKPVSTETYGQVLRSMVTLVRTQPLLRRRAAYHACLFGIFSLFWTTVPLVLAGPEFHLPQQAIALIMLAGVAGAVAAPVAGRFADAGKTRLATGLAQATVLVSLGLALLSSFASPWALTLLIVAAIGLDMGVSANLVLGQRAIFGLGDSIRSRLNGLYMATFFMGGAAGSAIGAWVNASAGWTAALEVALIPSVGALLYFATEFRSKKA